MSNRFHTKKRKKKDPVILMRIASKMKHSKRLPMRI